MSKASSKAVLKEVQDFRDCVKRVVAMLSGKSIPVAERGNEAFVRYNKRGEPVLVNIPSIPDDATPTLMNAVRGFLDHEVAHILFTDPKVAMKMREKGKAPSTGLWNALEDVFIERRMGQVFNGTRRNLLATQNLIIDKYFKTKVVEAVSICRGDQRDLFLKFFLCPVVRAWDGQSPFVEFMEDNWHYISKPVALLKEHGIDAAVRNMSSTEDCVKVAAAIAQIMKDMKEKPEGKLPEMKSSAKKPSKRDDESGDKPEAPEKPSREEATPGRKEEGGDKEEEAKDRDSGDSDSPDLLDKDLPTDDKDISDTSNDSSETGKEEHGEHPDTDEDGSTTPPDSANEEGSGSEGDGSPAPGDGIQDDADDSDGYGSGEDDTAEHGGAGDGDGVPGEEDEESYGSEKDEGTEETPDGDTGFVAETDGMTLEDALKALDEIEDGTDEMTEDALSETISKELMSGSLSDYRPYDRSYDFIGPIDEAEEHIKRAKKVFGAIPMHSPVDRYRMVPEGRKLFELQVEEHLSAGVSSTLAKDLERAIASRNRVQFVPGQRRGRVHGSSLYRLAMKDDRVFRRKEDHKAVNACVQQVIDLSGSMGGRKIHLALASAYTIADALDRINVPNIITGFTTFGAPDHGTMSKRGFSRFEALMLPIIKNWNEKANSPEIRARMGCVGETFPLLNNVDGESIAQLASLFSGRTEDKKIMLVMSDGAPCAAGDGFSEHLRTVAKEIEHLSDIDLMAIGILTNAPKRYYKNYALVNSVEELGPSVVTELSRIILG
ncbi:TPA: porphyrin biosynthesis protein [Salmonella enterica subsp. enterica serovar Concord]|uniref:cobaltochelatase CobT-related protein n=1 Tax=Enterobacteriaceae TaxID=543 RepID=UPI000DEC401B|nr:MULTISPECIES: porphyrin biosynthesis protein [Enterobacteriaceae]EBS2684454.1 porphyrin biosynthesis protein [Salmonella enterica subsp. enterica serovar Montevideo]HED0044515.1 porphyrin biosynthesis protein [Salmonella enterica subsp. enterica serovar Kentucky]AXD22147.1 porphyrin biosynthesis protein [Salmonella enterica]EAR9329319.1 porphyrin biosynthesis protein [Salmonella enterica]EAS2413084.1 porphyrin biosynthesis protein [Salmonella enterica]